MTAAPADPSIGDALRSARLLVSGSAPLSVREHTAIERLTGQRVIERYGLTETLINCSTRVDGDRRAGGGGPPLDGVELRLVDDERRPLARDPTAPPTESTRPAMGAVITVPASRALACVSASLALLSCCSAESS